MLRFSKQEYDKHICKIFREEMVENLAGELLWSILLKWNEDFYRIQEKRLLALRFSEQKHEKCHNISAMIENLANHFGLFKIK